MVGKRDYGTLKYLLGGGLFVMLLLYFGIFNRYHILYLEQNQLFRFSLDYLKEQFSLPGGLSLLMGNFFTQFFIFPWIGAIIITLNAFAVFVISNYIYSKHNIKNIILAIVPVWILAMLQSNELYKFDQAIGFLFLILFFAIYISIYKSGLRYIFYFAGWPILYLLIGGYSVPAVLLCALHEMLYRRENNHRIIFFLFILAGAVVPFLSAYFLFYITTDKIFIFPILTELHSYPFYALILLLVWNPLLLLINYFLKKIDLVSRGILSWNMTNVLAGALVIALMGYIIYKYSYNKRAELMLGIDHHIQQAEWEKVLKLSEQYPDLNRLVVYYTNLALYKTGHLSDRMFGYPQIGSNGLRLKWERNSNLFFGGEVFYHLSYTNEAYRWAFESMVAKGLNPRSLKRLVKTSIINGDKALAEKYINLLSQTLFYRNWANQYNYYLSDPKLIKNNNELSRNKDLIIHSDFISHVNDLNLDDLLLNHPGNKMAYEYLLASLLLNKNLDAFAKEILRLKDFGYKTIPVHFEEALVFYNFYENKNVTPEGYTIKPEAIKRFREYGISYTRYRKNLAVAAKELKKKYGKTYWYYLQFINNEN